MRNELMTFEGNEIEILEINEQVLFNPYHVGSCLHMEATTVRDHLAAMNDNQVVLLKNSNVGISDIRKFHNTGEKFLTESGLYKLTFKSRKPEAEKFTDWVADKVLPQIRKTGSYTTITNAERLKAMQIISRSTKFTLPYVIAVAKPFVGEINVTDNKKTSVTGNAPSCVVNFLDYFGNVFGLVSAKVYSYYCEYCRDNESTPLSHIAFSRSVCNLLDCATKSVKINGNVVRVFTSKS